MIMIVRKSLIKNKRKIRINNNNKDNDDDDDNNDILIKNYNSNYNSIYSDYKKHYY